MKSKRYGLTIIVGLILGLIFGITGVTLTATKAEAATNIYSADRCWIDGSHLPTAIGYFNTGRNCYSGNGTSQLAPGILFDTVASTAAAGQEANHTDEVIAVTLDRTVVLSGTSRGNRRTFNGQTVLMGVTITGLLSQTTIDARPIFESNAIACVFNATGTGSKFHNVVHLDIRVPNGKRDRVFCVDGTPIPDAQTRTYATAERFYQHNVNILEEGNTDSDGDGVPNDADICPDEAQGATPDPTRLGCPAPVVAGCTTDTDADGFFEDAACPAATKDQCVGENSAPNPDPTRPGCLLASAGGSNIPVCAINRTPGMTSSDGRISYTVTWTATNATSIAIDPNQLGLTNCPNDPSGTCTGTYTTAIAATPGTYPFDCTVTGSDGAARTYSYPVEILAGPGGGGTIPTDCDLRDQAADCDGDTVANGTDNCKLLPNTGQEDTNKDAIGDVCQVPTSLSDVDNDGLTDAEEAICGTDKNKADTDGDGLDDFEECTNPIYPRFCSTNPDCDADVLCDGGAEIPGVCSKGPDNCRIVSNPDQLDNNKNNIGDLCEGDTDGDTVCDGDAQIGDFCTAGPDNCILPNPDQADSNHNGIGDTCESVFALTAAGDGGCGCSVGGSAAPTVQWFGMVLSGLGLAFLRRMRKR
ncbi:MAG: MYXO-CTERM sorting domain-containing protein [Deltaproteobacteria bacterium]|nr:MYXO-CTERM sorting domain-containing protein [Deltaproteobacteria bacterium]